MHSTVNAFGSTAPDPEEKSRLHLVVDRKVAPRDCRVVATREVIKEPLLFLVKKEASTD